MFFISIIHYKLPFYPLVCLFRHSIIMPYSTLLFRIRHIRSIFIGYLKTIYNGTLSSDSSSFPNIVHELSHLSVASRNLNQSSGAMLGYFFPPSTSSGHIVSFTTSIHSTSSLPLYLWYNTCIYRFSIQLISSFDLLSSLAKANIAD